MSGTNKALANAIRLPAIATFHIEDGKRTEAWERFGSGGPIEQMKT